MFSDEKTIEPEVWDCAKSISLEKKQEQKLMNNNRWFLMSVSIS
jgi:hypothetical protein